MRRGLPFLLLIACAAAWPGAAAGEPASGPHETLDNQLTTTKPNAATGFTFKGRYHAAGDPSGNPPYMRKMIFYQPRGLRRDTSVPDRCSASDVELVLSGAAACPPGSRLGGGTTTGLFMETFPTEVEVEVFNNTDEQVMLARSPFVSTVVRGRIHPDGSAEFASPTCYPSVPGAACPVDNVLQIESSISVAPYTRPAGRGVRSYMTTPPKCPKAGRWQSTVKLWWDDGSVDTVAIENPCTRPRAKKRVKRRR